MRYNAATVVTAVANDLFSHDTQRNHVMSTRHQLPISIKTALPIIAVACAAVIGMGHGPRADKEERRLEAASADQMTLKKFRDVEVQEFPWGWIRWTMNGQIDNHSNMTFGVVYIKPHQTNPLHRHPKADEILHVVEGSCEHRMGDQWVKMQAGDTIRIPHGVVHNARTLDEPCRVVVVYDTGQRQMIPVDEQ